MAEESSSKADKKQIKEERNRLKQEEKKQKQEIKKRAKEISKREAEIEAEEEAGNGVSSFLITTVIVLVWIAILGFAIKLDFGGFASEFLTPVLKNVPVINKILPGDPQVTETTEEGAYGGYTSLKEAVDYIHELEVQLEHAQTVNNTNAEELTALKAEVERLQSFEQMQVEFQRIKEQFSNEMIYSDKGPGPEGFQKYYEALDPSTAEALYKQVVKELEEDKEYEQYVNAFSNMKAKQAAGILEKEDENLAARILKALDVKTRGEILGAMNAEKAAKLVKIMEPQG